MTYRELRDFGEMMRSLGYSRMVSMQNFRTPNFELVHDCLLWLIKRYDPTLMHDIPESIGTEKERVLFINSVVQVLGVKARLKLLPKSLYAADGFAVKELNKLASTLYKAMRAGAAGEGSGDGDGGNFSDFAPPGAQISDMKHTRMLAGDIIRTGAELFDLLDDEVAMRAIRERAVGRSVTDDMDALERTLREHVASVSETARETEQILVRLEGDEKNLMSKIEAKKGELERNEKRLHTLHTVRPAHMDEYEKLETRLQEQFNIYLEHHRNLDFLEHEMEVHHIAESTRAQESELALQRLQMHMHEQEHKMMTGEHEFRSAAQPNGRRFVDDDGDFDSEQQPQKPKRPRAASGSRSSSSQQQQQQQQRQPGKGAGGRGVSSRYNDSDSDFADDIDDIDDIDDDLW